jgi:hypothetical protein
MKDTTRADLVRSVRVGTSFQAHFDTGRNQREHVVGVVSRTFREGVFVSVDGARHEHEAFVTHGAVGFLRPAPVTAAAQGEVLITLPAHGSTLIAIHLVYEADPGPRDDHVHVCIDSDEVGILRKLTGTDSRIEA